MYAMLKVAFVDGRLQFISEKIKRNNFLQDIYCRLVSSSAMRMKVNGCVTGTSFCNFL